MKNLLFLLMSALLWPLYLSAQEFTIVEKSTDKGMKYGFMNENGVLVIPCEFDEVEKFNQYGFARASISATKNIASCRRAKNTALPKTL